MQESFVPWAHHAPRSLGAFATSLGASRGRAWLGPWTPLGDPVTTGSLFTRSWLLGTCEVEGEYRGGVLVDEGADVQPVPLSELLYFRKMIDVDKFLTFPGRHWKVPCLHYFNQNR